MVNLNFGSVVIKASNFFINDKFKEKYNKFSRGIYAIQNEKVQQLMKDINVGVEVRPYKSSQTINLCGRDEFTITSTIGSAEYKDKFDAAVCKSAKLNGLDAKIVDDNTDTPIIRDYKVPTVKEMDEGLEELQRLELVG